jgi:hypothetical protein
MAAELPELLQAYEPPPLAVKVVGLPAQADALVGVIETEGGGLTVNVFDAVAEVQFSKTVTV